MERKDQKSNNEKKKNKKKLNSNIKDKECNTKQGMIGKRIKQNKKSINNTLHIEFSIEDDI